MGDIDVRTKILDTAIKVAVDSGIKGLTIDNVAATAGMSKGGVFYHFKSKEELLEAMVNHIIDQFEAECEKLQQSGMDPLMASIESAFTASTEQKNRICAMVAAVAHDRTIPSRTNLRFEEWINELQSSGCSRGTALLVVHAIDGYYMSNAFEMVQNIDRDREILKERLLEIVRADMDYWYVQAFRHAVKMAEAEELVNA